MQAFHTRYRITYAEENIGTYRIYYICTCLLRKRRSGQGGGNFRFLFSFLFLFSFSVLFFFQSLELESTVPRWLGVAWEKRKEQKEKGEGGGGASQAQMQGRGLKINGKWYHRKNKSHVKRVEHIPHIEGLGIRLVIYHSLLILT